MKILIVDAQGGGMGRQLVASIRKEFPKAEITAAGTNSIATSNMLKAGADHAATGENAVVVGSRKADIIIGPVGIAIADSMYGEITPAMAAAVGQSDAKKLLIPMNQCNNVIVGVKNTSMSYMVEAVIEQLRNEEVI
ncbi:MAG: DUF3842 family protein [Dorea sp.]|jgi:hypothetical protein|uniref:DUF3842 family protein n=1 Tax=Sporofaciens sp. JLR.KK001 TaxID=3112621 RepID=UPI00217475D7|nr:DUF3842 family protein [Dorea sp.]